MARPRDNSDLHPLQQSPSESRLFQHEITVKPLRRLIMGQPIVMFRCKDGTIAVLEDRCSHRNFP